MTARELRNPAMGAVVDGAHVLRLRVYYEDTDAGGVVYYANYLRYAERARTEFLRCVAGTAAERMRADGMAFAVRHCTADYRRPARLDDAIEVHTRITDVGGASLAARQEVRRGAELLVEMTVRLACMNGLGRPARMPTAVKRALGACLHGPDTPDTKRI
jgi:acyl-CoA thioester hydrolase